MGATMTGTGGGKDVSFVFCGWKYAAII